LLFPEELATGVEQSFVAFLLLFAPCVFGLPSKTAHPRELRVRDTSLLLFTSGTGVSYKGVVDLRSRDTRPFEMAKNFEFVLLSTMGSPPVPEKIEMEEMNEKLLRAKKKANVLLPPRRVIEEKISYDDLFV
jgi:hypothetical protein